MNSPAVFIFWQTSFRLSIVVLGMRSIEWVQKQLLASKCVKLATRHFPFPCEKFCHTPTMIRPFYELTTSGQCRKMRLNFNRCKLHVDMHQGSTGMCEYSFRKLLRRSANFCDGISKTKKRRFGWLPEPMARENCCKKKDVSKLAGSPSPWLGEN